MANTAAEDRVDMKIVAAEDDEDLRLQLVKAAVLRRL